mmetsp:Transcript_5468/g.12593  ORF Transcript_5468/g.12593 Transcript_5468/m.12593 type:complete len:245 (+) Transcript_5468:447-1181(+)
MRATCSHARRMRGCHGECAPEPAGTALRQDLSEMVKTRQSADQRRRDAKLSCPGHALARCEAVVLQSEPFEKVGRRWRLERLVPALKHEPEPLLLVEDDLAVEMFGVAHDDAHVAAFLAVLRAFGARHRVGREAVQHVRRAQQVLPELPLLLLHLVVGGRLRSAELEDGARARDEDVGEDYELGVDERGAADVRRGVVVLGVVVGDGRHLLARRPLDDRVVDGMVDRPLVARLPARLLLTLVGD